MNMKVDNTNGVGTTTVLDTTSGTGGLAESSIPFVPLRKRVKVEPVEVAKVDPVAIPTPDPKPDPDLENKLKDEGMSRGMANFQAGAGIGLGLLSFLENRKTSKLQREALRHDIDTAKEHRANRQALGASFSAGLSKGLAAPSAPPANPPAKQR